MNNSMFKGSIDFEQLVKQNNSVSRKQSTLLIAIDGCGGSGKSTTEKLPCYCRYFAHSVQKCTSYIGRTKKDP